MILLRLPREPRDERRPQTDIRDPLPQLRDHVRKFLPVRPPPHTFQDPVRRVLYRNVKIIAYLRFSLYCLDQFIGDLFRVTIQDSYPVNPLDRTQPVQQLGETLFAVQVCPVERRLLRHQDEFPHTGCGEMLRLPDQAVDRDASVVSPHLRNDTVAAVLVTALRDL